MIGNWEIAAVADALADRCEQVSVALLGRPSSASRRELRFGRAVRSRCDVMARSEAAGMTTSAARAATC
jgi:hypothetical protein